MGMNCYPIQGVGICMNSLDWKDPDIFQQMIDDGGDFYSEMQPNGVTAVIDFVIVNGACSDGSYDDYHLITYNYKPYAQTPFESEDALKDFYIRGLREHVHNTEQEIRDLIDSIDATYWG